MKFSKFLKIETKMELNSVITVIILYCLLSAIDLTQCRPQSKFKCLSEENFPVICNSTRSYPAKRIEKLLRQKSNLKKFKHLSGFVVEPAKNDFVPRLRFNDDETIQNMCRTRRVQMKPLWGLDSKMQRRYIVNIPPSGRFPSGFEQVVEYELCLDKDNGCFGNQVFPLDMTTSCEQTYTWVRLVSLSPTSKLEYAAHKVPSTCVCTYKKQFA